MGERVVGGVRAPQATAPLNASVQLSGSKSAANRELVLAALATEASELTGIAPSRDTRLMVGALRSLGIEVEVESEGAPVSEVDRTAAAETVRVRVNPSAGGFRTSGKVFCGLAGTVLRFAAPLAGLARGKTRFTGDEYCAHRPMRAQFEAMRQLGIELECESDLSLPFTVHGTGRIAGGKAQLDAAASSQFISALLLSAARFEEGAHIRHTGSTLPSLPHIDMTVAALNARGIRVQQPREHEWIVEPGAIAARSFRIEPDLSNAAPFLAAPLLAGGEVTVHNWPEETEQVGAKLPQYLEAFGAHYSRENGALRVSGAKQLTPVDLNLAEAGELAPTLIGLACFAPGVSSIRGIAHIRGHETDRIAALTANIRAMGGQIEELDDGVRIHGGRALKPALWRSHADHRMATTGALIALAVPQTVIDDLSCTSKTLPDFARLWAAMLAPGAAFSPTGGVK